MHRAGEAENKLKKTPDSQGRTPFQVGSGSTLAPTLAVLTYIGQSVMAYILIAHLCHSLSAPASSITTLGPTKWALRAASSVRRPAQGQFKEGSRTLEREANGRNQLLRAGRRPQGQAKG